MTIIYKLKKRKVFLRIYEFNNNSVVLVTSAGNRRVAVAPAEPTVLAAGVSQRKTLKVTLTWAKYFKSAFI